MLPYLKFKKAQLEVAHNHILVQVAPVLKNRDCVVTCTSVPLCELASFYFFLTVYLGTGH